MFIHFFNILKSACNTNNFIIQYYCYYILLELSILGFLSLGVTAEIITLFLMIIQIVIALKGEMPMCSNNKLVVYGAYGVVNLSILLKILVQARLGGSKSSPSRLLQVAFCNLFLCQKTPTSQSVSQSLISIIQFPHITISNNPTITGIVAIDSSVVNTYSELEYAASLS